MRGKTAGFSASSKAEAITGAELTLETFCSYSCDLRRGLRVSATDPIEQPLMGSHGLAGFGLQQCVLEFLPTVVSSHRLLL